MNLYENIRITWSSRERSIWTGPRSTNHYEYYINESYITSTLSLQEIEKERQRERGINMRERRGRARENNKDHYTGIKDSTPFTS